MVRDHGELNHAAMLQKAGNRADREHRLAVKLLQVPVETWPLRIAQEDDVARRRVGWRHHMNDLDWPPIDLLMSRNLLQRIAERARSHNPDREDPARPVRLVHEPCEIEKEGGFDIRLFHDALREQHLRNKYEAQVDGSAPEAVPLSHTPRMEVPDRMLLRRSV